MAVANKCSGASAPKYRDVIAMERMPRTSSRGAFGTVRRKTSFKTVTVSAPARPLSSEFAMPRRCRSRYHSVSSRHGAARLCSLVGANGLSSRGRSLLLSLPPRLGHYASAPAAREFADHGARYGRGGVEQHV